MEAIKELKKEFIKNKERFIQIGYNPQLKFTYTSVYFQEEQSFMKCSNAR